MYLLLKASTQGEPCTFLDEKELRELLADPGSWGVTEFLDELPDIDPMHWDEHVAALLKVELLSPVKKVAWVLPEDEEPETMFPFKAPTDRLRATWLTRDGIIDTSEQSI